MQRFFKIEGIIIKRVNIGESDKIVTLYTKNLGKIKVRAKGIRKIHSRKAPHLELFNRIYGFIAKGKVFDIVTEVETIQSFPSLRANLSILAYAYKIIEEVERLCPEEQEHKEIYFLLTAALKKLNDNITPPQKITDEFSLFLLWELGYLPRDKIVSGEVLEQYFEQIMERKLKSNSLLTKIH